MFERSDIYNELFTISVNIPISLMLVVLTLVGYGIVTSKNLSDKWIWFYFGALEILAAFFALKILPLFCNDNLVVLITGLFCLISFALICSGLFRFKKLSSKP